jgi:ribonuclease D
MSRGLITDQAAFDALCDDIENAGEVAFDTEFVSEHTYRPELGLLQFATAERQAAVDPLAVHDLSRWWRIMSEGRVLVVVHGSREEVRFCLANAQRPPGKIFDVQIAEGLQSRSFPMSYTSLVSRVLGQRTSGKETRTDWTKRPLTDRQIAYALEDVEFLLEIARRQRGSLQKRGRLAWAETEIARYIDDIVREPMRENWRKLPGIQSLSARELAVVREVYAWREAEATGRNRPARRILRDDLVIELAKRQPADAADLMATRDMNRSDYRRSAEAMLAAIRRALELDRAALPEVRRTEKDPDEQIMAQLLSLALANRCAQEDVAMGLVGTTSDLRHLVRWHVYKEQEGDPPRLSLGWRATVCGDLLTDVLAGKVALRVSDPSSEHPLVFERRDIP